MKVLLGLSGGVDSAVAAYLLKKEGHDVTCCFMRNRDSMANNDVLGNPTISDPICPQEQDYLDAEDVAKKLDLSFIRLDFIEEYRNDVFSYFLAEYKKGRTPNPDVFCNKYIKFGPFLKYAESHGFDSIAMGHYAKRIDKDGRSYLLRAKDSNKDQTYFLAQISFHQLSSCLFPLGDILKSEVREIAHELGLKTVMDKKDSTGVCFIGERHFKEFLENYLPSKKGEIRSIEDGRLLGEHDGILYYTIGQRRGLGIGGIKGETASGRFVCKKDVAKNILYVARGDDEEELLSDEAEIDNLNFFNGRPEDGSHLSARFRYRQKDVAVTVSSFNEEIMKVSYPQGFKAVTPGQVCVLYFGEYCLGSGIIRAVYRHGKLKNY
jgi:tRNA-specific 2-thiouridylase